MVPAIRSALVVLAALVVAPGPAAAKRVVSVASVPCDGIWKTWTAARSCLAKAGARVLHDAETIKLVEIPVTRTRSLAVYVRSESGWLQAFAHDGTYDVVDLLSVAPLSIVPEPSLRLQLGSSVSSYQSLDGETAEPITVRRIESVVCRTASSSGSRSRGCACAGTVGTRGRCVDRRSCSTTISR
jgi:hypothetical protein